MVGVSTVRKDMEMGGRGGEVMEEMKRRWRGGGGEQEEMKKRRLREEGHEEETIKRWRR